MPHCLRHVARFVCAAIACSLLLLSTHGVMAQETTPWQDAEQMRQTLFDAQKALILGKAAQAQQGVTDAAAIFDATLSPALADSAPAVVAVAKEGFADAQAAANNGDAVALAVARSRNWTALLDGGYRTAIQAVAQRQPDVAQSWLLLREFRTATRFSRPDADATLAITALREERGTTEQAEATLKADLLDTYQARLMMRWLQLMKPRLNSLRSSRLKRQRRHKVTGVSSRRPTQNNVAVKRSNKPTQPLPRLLSLHRQAMRQLLQALARRSTLH